MIYAVVNGRFTKDPEIRIGKNNNVQYTLFTIASNYRKDEVNYVECICFDPAIVGIVEKHAYKGCNVGVAGELTLETYTSEQYGNVSKMKLVVKSFAFNGGKRNE